MLLDSSQTLDGVFLSYGRYEITVRATQVRFRVIRVRRTVLPTALSG